jgi:2-methylcitrate dehydratase PrpD
MKNQKPAKVSPLMHRLSSYVAGAAKRKLPAAVLEATKHHILDTLAAALSGSKLLPGKHAIAFARSQGGTRQCTVIGTRILTNPITAALANGMLAHADETDDSHAASMTHPGCGIVSGALAMAELEGSDGMALLRAVTLGYDVSSRMGRALHAARFRNLGHSVHCIAPTFGTAAAGAVLARMDARRVRHVLSYAAQQASGLSCYTSDIDHIEKSFDFGGMPARNGVTAATLVRAGCTGVEDVFVGERTFFQAYDESARLGEPLRPGFLVKDLGKTYEVLNTNIKRWSVGSPIQAPADSLLALIRAHAIRAEDVEEVIVRVWHGGANTTDDNDMPDVCMQYICAVMLLDGYLTFEAAHDVKRMRDRKVLALRKKIRLLGDDKLEKIRIEQGKRQGIVEIRLKDGRHLRHHTTAVRGAFNNPMTRAEVDEKCHHLIAPVLGDRKARQLCDFVWGMEKVRHIGAIRPLLQG